MIPGHTNADAAFLDILHNVRTRGLPVLTRNAPCRRLIAQRYDFNRTPLVTVRKTSWKNCLREWEFFMSGSDRLSDLHESVRHWWKPWADDHGRLPFTYSLQFRSSHGSGDGWNELKTEDQIQYLINGVRDHPHSRRNVITTWNTAEVTNESSLISPCHGTVIQAFVGSHEDSNRLNLYTYQRSADVVCGLPHNWLQYFAFLLWLAHRTGTNPGSLIWQGGDVHVYDAHRELSDKIEAESVKAIETRRMESGDEKRNWESPPCFNLAPELVYTPTSDEFKADDFSLNRPYDPLVTDRAEMVV